MSQVRTQPTLVYTLIEAGMPCLTLQLLVLTPTVTLSA
jgi:hypothetical protein